MFDVLLSLDGSMGRIIGFEVDELVYPVALRVSLDAAALMLVHPPDEVVCYANIKCATGTAREDV
jgi:hypothetical protein